MNCALVSLLRGKTLPSDFHGGVDNRFDHTMATMVLFGSMETSPSIISAETRSVMDAVTRRVGGRCCWTLVFRRKFLL